MKEIRIEGLTTDQRDMLDIMWELDSVEEFIEWMETLTPEDVLMALTLKELILAYCMDEIDDTSIAKQYLKKYRL